MGNNNATQVIGIMTVEMIEIVTDIAIEGKLNI